MRNGSDDDRTRGGAFGAPPSVGVPDDEPFALGELVAALRRPADLGPGVDSAVMSAIRLAPAPLVVVAGAAGRAADPHRTTDGAVAGSPATRLPARTRAVAPAARPAALPTALPRAWRWFTSPRSVRVSPLGALAAAGIAVAAVIGLRRDPGRRADDLGAASDQSSATGEFAAVRGAERREAPASAAAGSAAAARTRDTVYLTRFVVVAPGAKQVTVVGDFNEWDHHANPLTRVASPDAKPGTWTVELPLAAGRHSYAFLVDGQRWLADPFRPRAIGDDDFGRPNSVVTVQGET